MNAQEPQPLPDARPITVIDHAASPRPAAAEHSPPDALSLPGVPIRDAWADLSLVLVTAVLAQYGAEVVVLAVSPPPNMSETMLPSSAIWIKKGFELLMAGVLVAYLAYRNRLGWSAYGLSYTNVLGADFLQPGPAKAAMATLMHAVWAILTLVGAYAALLFATVLLLIGFAIMKALGHPPNLENMQNPAFNTLMPLRGWPLLSLFLIVALHEELIFRSLLAPLFRRVTGSWVSATIIASVIFSTLHLYQSGYAVFSLTAVAVVFTLSLILTRSVIPAMLAHFAFNSLQIEIARVYLDWMSRIQQSAAAPS